MSSATSWDRTGFFVIIVDDYPFAANAFQSGYLLRIHAAAQWYCDAACVMFIVGPNLFWVHLYFWVSVDNIPG
jgi:hypothetical protein